MANGFRKLEQQFFRRLNNVVEPLVRSGFGSLKLAPASLIVLESTGFKSGESRRTPLWSVRLGRYRVIATARGRRSFWVRNLQKCPEASYYVGGESLPAEAILLSPGFNNLDDWELNSLLSRVVSGLSGSVKQGWAFALLVPAKA